ncbi:uncharacterized protein LOC110228644 [Arabidopsis lyrata subsp. lyrata]|uniref:uncharacterized protein LOC110228644 n=1 Tax=Arabidopsis lyrata subsp. lyrata TaxID=81972 RepID=UPI000A29A38A|nr:uncharacterized protein LOC110228644 [Arabidopsis lyrata subsp. lyrata]|eukprot:XP_020882199.1 uncharacterized protein LOC110228644 [Arabidopsis lyrata subsp. lyrata]
MKNGGGNLISMDVPRLDHLFRQLGLGPFHISSRPNFIRCIPLLPLQKPRFGLNILLSLLSKFLCRFKEPIVRGRRLEANQTSLLFWYKFYLRTWPLDSPRGITHDFQSLKNTLSDSFLYRGLLEKLRKNGIMIPSPRSGGYRIFLNPLSLYPLFTELIHVQIINFRDYFHTLNALKLRSGYFLYVLSRLQALCGILNLHGIAHVREDPPVLLRLYTHILRTLVLASSGILKDHGLMLLNPPCGIFDGGVGSFSNDHSSSSSSGVFKLYVFNTTSFCYV